MRVLVVEDDLDIRKALVDLLRGHGHAVSGAGAGAEGLAAIAGDRPDAILLDLALPDMGGDQFLEALRQDARFENIPVVVMSGWARTIDPPVPVAGWLPKPIDPGQLLAMMERLGGAPAHGAGR